MSAADDSDLQLLLSDAGDCMPVLEDGLETSALAAAEPPAPGARGEDSMHLDAPDRDPNDLAAQRWGVIAPRGEAGDRMLADIDALVQHRAAQQGATPRIYRVDPGMDARASTRWKHDVLRAEEVPEHERPRYLLILGDLDEVSIELQHVLANGAFVGRLALAGGAARRAYAEKVAASEAGAPPSTSPRALYYTVQDGTSAVGIGYRRLVQPCIDMTRRWAEAGKLSVDAITEIPYSDWGPDEMLQEAGVDAPSVLLSLSHGLGAPRRGWRSADHQRALQGALSMGMEEPLTADALRETPFLPGGLWVCVACFAAGTPPESAFYPWLAQLAERGGQAGAEAVLRSLPRDGERPFVAALPQAVLANPRGPVALVGHMDLAWTYGFSGSDNDSRASRVFSLVRSLLAGSRAGVGLDALMRAYREVNDDLMTGYHLQRDARARGQPDPVDPSRLGRLWMTRNDLRGYVLLGDPAARARVPGDAGPRARSVKQDARDSSIELWAPPGAATTERSPGEQQEDLQVMPSHDLRSPAASDARAGLVPGASAPVEPRAAAPPGATSQHDPRVGGYDVDPRAASFAAPVSVPVGEQTPWGLASRVTARERAVLAFFRGDESPRGIAARFGLTLDELFDWIHVYREAGRSALAR